MKPRLFGIPATRSPVVAILRRGPSDWSQILRWDPHAGTLDRGSWIRANLYPQRCDLSPDGRFLTYFTLRPTATWAAGPTYIADASRRLERVQWADWDQAGRLLVATTTGRLEVRREPWGGTDTAWWVDLGDDRPEPAEPPSVARRWIE